MVDDNQDAAESLELLLQLLGHEVRLASDGRMALKLAHEFLPEVVLLDIGLPLLNGYEVACLIRQETWGQSMHLVALTGWGQAEDRQKTMDAGFDHDLTNPVNPADLDSILVYEDLHPLSSICCTKERSTTKLGTYNWPSKPRIQISASNQHGWFLSH